MAARYRYLLTDLLTGRVLSDAVALQVASYARRLNAGGTCSATMDLSDPTVRALTDPVAATEPRRTALWIIRNEQPVWGGIIWTRRYRSGDAAFDISATGFESYFARRRMRRNYLFGGWDQHDILWELVSTAQSEHRGGNIRVATPRPRRSGTVRDRYYWWHERATFLERMQQLSEVSGGPDFTIEPGWADTGVPGATLQVGTPLGSELTGLVIEFPGDVRNYSWPDDGGDSANFWTAIGDKPEGAEQDEPPPMRDAQMSAEWDVGIPLLEDVSQHQGVVDVGTLQGYANANVVASSGNRVVPSATIRLPEQATLPGLGDTLTVRVTDPYRFPADSHTGAPGLQARVRLTGWQTYLSADEGETLTATLSELA